MEERLFGLTTADLRNLAYQLSVKNGKIDNFNTDKEMACVNRLKGFLSHQDLSISEAEATSAARVMEVNKVAVVKFYQLLDYLYNYKLSPDKIYNCREIEISAIYKAKSKIL